MTEDYLPNPKISDVKVNLKWSNYLSKSASIFFFFYIFRLSFCADSHITWKSNIKSDFQNLFETVSINTGNIPLLLLNKIFSCIYLFIYLFIHLFIYYLFIHSFIYWLIDLYIYLFIYLFIHFYFIFILEIFLSEPWIQFLFFQCDRVDKDNNSHRKGFFFSCCNPMKQGVGYDLSIWVLNLWLCG